MDLSLLFLLPVLTAIIVFLVPDKRHSRVIALAGAVAQLFLVGFLIRSYFLAGPVIDEGFRFVQRFSWFPSFHIDYFVGVDGIALSMIALTSLVVLAGILVSWNVEKSVKEFFILLLLLSAGAYGFFISLDLFLQFFFLEVAVIPKYLLIGVWGSGKKEYSANKLALMLMGGSALVFIGLLGIYFRGSAASFDILQAAGSPISNEDQLFFFPFLFLGFGVFTALFPFHTWVPDGHSSAPTAGSMFLAGISMKLGGYGCLRVAAYLMPFAAAHYSGWIIALSTIAVLYGAFATMMQTDLKYINAYSSVSHCGFVLLGIGMLTKTSIQGAVLQMVSHGLMTALFFAAIGMLYERTHTRKVSELGGLMKSMPFISTLFFLAGLCSLGLPGLSGFVSEMTVFVGAWERAEFSYRLMTILSCASIVVTAVYILRALGKSIMGQVGRAEYAGLSDAAWNERLAAGALMAGILVIGLLPFLLNNLVLPDIDNIFQHIQQSITLR
ncbi:MAG: NuoM family protein [Bacteroidota bacterium]